MRQVAFCAVLTVLVAAAFSTIIDQDPETQKYQSTKKAMEAGCYNRDLKASKQALKAQTAKWPRAIVYYQWDPQTDWTPYDKQEILKGFGWISSKTCIRFQERKNEQAFVRIQSRHRGCNAEMGYQNREQYLNLEPDREFGGGCVTAGVVVHETLHVLGVDHEQNRPDRDDYITVLMENVQERYQRNYVKNMNTTTFGLPYDFDSIMHYARDAFSKNGKPTMVSKVPGKEVIAREHYSHLSGKDIALLNIMYNCWLN